MSPKTLGCLLGYPLLGHLADAQAVGNGYALIPYPASLVPARGSFVVTCDDGTLQIADRLVVDNGGLHSAIEKSGQVALGKGLQPFALNFVEGGGGYSLLLQYSLHGSPPQPVPAGWLRH